MKAKLVIVTGCLSLFMSSYALSDCGDPYGCGQSGGSGSCDFNEYNNVCQCTDRVCNSVDHGCLSPNECCEAFGNMGAR